MKQLIRYLIWFLPLFAAYNSQAQNNTVYGAGISYTNGAPSWVPNPRTSRAAVDTVTGRWYHFNTPGGWQWIGNTVEEIAGCAAPAYTPSKGDSRLVINNCVKPEVYWYDGTVWKWINEGEVYTAGQGIRIESNTIILDSLNFLDFRTGSALDGDVGRVEWNDTDGTLDLNLKGGNVTLQIGQEEVTLVKHADNSGLIEGRVVYIVGSDGANKTVRYALADSDLTSATTFGLMTESATGGNKAFCTTFGLVRNLNTTNLTEGGIVWLSADTAGQMTAVRPTAPDHGVMIGFCVRKHATQGAIFVQVQNGYELNELHDVFVPSPTNGQVLTWNSTNARWEATTPANQLQTLSTDGSAGNISISSGNTITLNVNDADASATNELQTLSVAANTATLSNSGGSVTIAGAGINTVGTAGTTITVTGTEVDGSTTNELQTLSTGTNTLTLSNGGGTVTVDTDPSTDVTGSGVAGQVSFWTGAQTQSGDNGLFWDNTNKRLGVGTNAPARALSIVGTGQTILGIKGGSGANQGSAHYFTFAGSGSTLFAYGDEAAIVGGTPDLAAMIWSNANIPLKFRLGGTSVPQFTFTANGRLLINTQTDNSFTLNVSGNGRFTDNLSLGTTSSSARIHVVGSGTGSATWTAQFHNSAGNNNALMIRDDGNVGIGTSAPGARLQITPSADQSAVSVTGYSITGANNQPALDIAGTWNTTAAPSAIRANITNTASSSQSLLINLQIGSVTRFSVRNDGVIFFGPSAAATSSIRATTDGTIQCNSGIGNIAGDEYIFTNGNIGTAKAHTSGTVNAIRTNIGFSPTSGTGLFNGYIYNGTINQTGGSTGITRGFYSNPTLASIADWRSFEFSNTTGWGIYGAGTAKSYFAGNVAIGTTTQNASSAFEVASTTQGILFPRMTTAQRDLIATPADGLVIYNTSTNKLQVRAGGAWVDLH